MENTTALRLATFVSLCSTISHMLAASLPTWLVSTLSVHLSTLGLAYSCRVDSGLFRAQIVSGGPAGECPATESGENPTHYVCGGGVPTPADDDTSVAVLPNDCSLLRAGQAGVVLASIFAAAAFLLLTFQLLRSKRELTFSKLQATTIPLTVIAATFELVNIIIFETRSRDSRAGWADSYGCHEGSIDLLFHASGTTCFYRGPAYVFACVGVALSAGLALTQLFVRKDFFNKEIKDRFDGSVHMYAALEDPVASSV
jgi:hypothetical protein